jgi:hypothetical protein
MEPCPAPGGVCGGECGGRGPPRAGRAIGRHTRDALGRSCLILLCFVTRGITCEAAALLASPSALMRLPASLLCFLVVRGVPVCPSRREGAKADLLPLARYAAPALPLVVAMPASGVVTGWRRRERRGPRRRRSTVRAALAPERLHPPPLGADPAPCNRPPAARETGHCLEEKPGARAVHMVRGWEVRRAESPVKRSISMIQSLRGD